MSDDNKNDDNNRPIATFRDGPLSTSVFRNQGEKGDFFNVVPRKIYTTDQGEVRESKSYTGTEPLRMAKLLDRAYDRVGEFKQEIKDQSRSNDRER